MQFGFSSLVALAAVVAAQSAEPKISANELVKSIKVITEAVQDAVEMTSNLPAEADDARVLSKDMIDIGRGSSVVVQALPRPDKGSTFQYPEDKQGPVCDSLEKMVDASSSLVDSLRNAVETLPHTPEFQDPITHSVRFMSKAVGGLVRRTTLTAGCEGVGEERAKELQDGFDAAVENL